MRFVTSDLCSKFGFEDGDILCDFVRDHFPRLHHRDVLAAVLEVFVVPMVEQHLETYRLETMHNPVRVRSIDGVEDFWGVVSMPLPYTLVPRVVEVSSKQLVALCTLLDRQGEVQEP